MLRSEVVTFVSIGQSILEMSSLIVKLSLILSIGRLSLFLCQLVRLSLFVCQLGKLSSVLSQLRLSSFLCQFVRLSFISILS